MEDEDDVLACVPCENLYLQVLLLILILNISTFVSASICCLSLKKSLSR